MNCSQRAGMLPERNVFRWGHAWRILVLMVTGFCFASVARGQAKESATAGKAFVWAGASASGYYLQYGTIKELGVSAFVDADTVRRFGIEGEGRWLEYHRKANVHVETYMIGPRYHFDVGRFQPYVKGMLGVGYFNFPYDYAHGSYLVTALGGGVDYHLRGRWSLRALDAEYQYWPQFTFGAMSSAGVSAGIRYRVF